MIKRLLIAAIAIAFAWFEPALAQQRPRQVIEHVGAMVMETYDLAATTAQRLAYATAARYGVCNSIVTGPRASNLRES